MNTVINQHTAQFNLSLGATKEEVKTTIAVIERVFAGVLGKTSEQANADLDDTLDAAAPPPAASANADGTVALDAEGLPWHADLHSKNATKTAAGIWTKRKNRDEAKAQAVIAELRTKFPAPVVAATPAPVVAAPVVSVPVAQTPYQKLVAFLTRNVDNAGLTQPMIDATFTGSNTTLADLAVADEATLQAFTDAFANFIATNGGTVK